MASVKNWCENNPHCQANLGLLREDMPQLAEEDFPAFLVSLRDQGVDADLDMVPVTDLTPTQAEINAEKALSMVGKVRKDQPLLVARGNFILDGHHRWAALVEEDPDQHVLVIRIDLGIYDLLQEGLDFGSAVRKDIKGRTVEASRRYAFWQDILK